MCKYTKYEQAFDKTLTYWGMKGMIVPQAVLEQVQINWGGVACSVKREVCRPAAANRCGLPGGIPGRMFRAVSPRGGVCGAERNFLPPAQMYATVVLERSGAIMKERISPCVGCGRVADPENCADKTCRLWQGWFLEKWEQTRQAIRQLKEEPGAMAGVNVGGVCYAAPDQVRSFLDKDPCDSCCCPKELCQNTCRKRRLWEKCHKEGL